MNGRVTASRREVLTLAADALEAAGWNVSRMTLPVYTTYTIEGEPAETTTSHRIVIRATLDGEFILLEESL